MNIQCECNFEGCNVAVLVSLEKVMRYLQTNAFVIANNCSVGPKPTDELLEEYETYKVYKETKV